MKKTTLDWKQTAEIAAVLDVKICQDIMSQLKSGPLCVNDLAGYLKLPRHAVNYNILLAFNAGLIRKSGDPRLNATRDAREVFMLTDLGKEYA